LVAREGWPHIAIAVAVALLLSFTPLWPLAIVAWLAVVFVVQFFRDPPREAPDDPNAVLCPADGRVLKVERTRDPYLDRDALLVSVFMNVFDVHSNRSPVDGVVANVWYHRGTFVNASLDKASLDNERNALQIAMADGQNVTCVQVAGLIARRILCYVKKGDRLARGQRYGFIRFGSRVDVYVDPAAAPAVAIGDVVYATSTILARLPG
jgi:phosphatidylserine decarboxylase